VNSRLAEIIALSIGPDGRPDPARIYETLRLSPDDPVAVIVEGVLAVKVTHDQQLAAMKAVLEAERCNVQQSLNQHATALLDATRLIGAEVTAINQARAAAQQEIASGAAQIVAEAKTLNVSAATISTRALITAFFVGLLLGVAVGASVWYFLRK
jgi:hypothetical protein